MSDTPSRRSTRSGASLASTPQAGSTPGSRRSGRSDRGAGDSNEEVVTPSSRSRSSRASKTPARADEEAMEVEETPRSGRREAPASTRSTRSSRVATSSIVSGGSQRLGRGNSDLRSMVSGRSGVPGSPGASDVSSLGLRSLSPTSKTFSSPKTMRGASDILNSPLNYGTPSNVSTPRTSGLATATPIRRRNDIDAEGITRHINVQPDGTVDDAPHLVIWGTNVSATELRTKFQRFLKTYKEDQVDEDEIQMDQYESAKPFYMQKLAEIHLLEDPYMNLNCAHLRHYDEELYRQLIAYPQEVIPTMDNALNEVFFEKYPQATLTQQIQIRPYNADKTKTMRYLNPEDIDQLVTVSGMIIRTSNLMPEMKDGFFKCSVCHHGAKAELDRGKILEPVLCPSCNTNFSFSLIHNRSSFVDKQLIRLQEDLEDTPVGETPNMATLFAHGDMVNLVQPGDRVSVTGIYRAAPFRLNPRLRTVRAVYKTYLDVVHFRKTDTKRMREGVDGKGLNIPQERIDFIKELATKEDIYERLARAIAPSIYEHEDVKKGILLQLFGGAKKEFENSGRGRFRSEVNILLCGDPGTSKSQLLKYVYDLIPRSQYTSGKGSSAVGLTAYVTKDPETKQLVLQTGALVLADNGVCCIDEFDKMNESTRSILHEVMEQQTLSIAKAGIICQLNARTSVLAAANPVESQWNQNKTIVENVNLPHTLLSRFDLIFLLLDPQNDIYDRRLAKHMISLYFQTQEEEDADFLDMSVLRDYVSYAKECVHPKLSDEASQRLIESYVDMRKIGSKTGHISAYPRQLESLIRLSEAHAKIRMSEKVEVADVEEALRLHREAMKQSATDPLTGKIDLSILATGTSSTSRKRKDEMANAVKKILEGKGRGPTLNYNKLFTELKEKSTWSVTKEMFEDVLKDLQDEGLIIVSTGKSTVRMCQ